MKDAPEAVPNRNGTRYSAADKLKAVKLYLEEWWSQVNGNSIWKEKWAEL